MPSVSVTAGSESYIKGGSIIPYNPIGIGSVFLAGGIGSVVISGTHSAWTGIGSVYLAGGTGSVVCSGITQIAGSIWSMPNVSVSVGSESYIKGGSVIVYNPVGIGSVFLAGGIGSVRMEGVGSVVISGGVVGVSGTALVTQWTGTGSVVISGIPIAWSGLGSVYSYAKEVSPISTNLNNPLYSFTYIGSSTANGAIGSVIGSINMYIGATNYVQIITWQSGLILTIGSWSAV